MKNLKGLNLKNNLNNQRYNLRKCTHQQNLQNRQLNKNNTSGYKGVKWAKRNKKWRVRIGTPPNRKHIGLFTCVIKAAKAYDKRVFELSPEFAYLNFPDIKQEEHNPKQAIPKTGNYIGVCCRLAFVCVTYETFFCCATSRCKNNCCRDT